MVWLLFEGSEACAPSADGSRLALGLAQQLAGGIDQARVLLLTFGALGVYGSCTASEASHGGVWGFARVQRLEYPSLRVQTADVHRDANDCTLHRPRGHKVEKPRFLNGLPALE